MSREIALTLAVQAHTRDGLGSIDALLETAEKFAAFLGASTAAPAAAPPKTRGKKADAAPTEPVAVAEDVKPAEPVAVKAEPAPAPAANTQVTVEAVRTAIGKAAGNPKVGPTVVRAALAKCVNPDTGVAATNVSTLHVSHYKQIVDELTAAVAKAAAEPPAA